MAVNNLRDAIQGVEVFSTLDDKTIDALIQAGATLKYSPGHTLVEQGALGGGLQLFLDGGATVVVNGEARRELGVGDYFGEMSLFDETPRSATIIAGAAGAKTFTLSPLSFGDVLDANPRVGRAVVRTLARRVLELESRAAAQQDD